MEEASLPKKIWDRFVGILHMFLCCFELGGGEEPSHDVPLSDDLHGSPSAMRPDYREQDSLLGKPNTHSGSSSSRLTSGASTSGSLDTKGRGKGAKLRTTKDAGQTAEDLRFTKLLPPTFSAHQLQQTASFQRMADEDVCAICLEEYADSNPKSFLTCGHAFHLGCILEWEERGKNMCPLCDVQVGSSLGD